MIEMNDLSLERILWYKAPKAENVTPNRIDPGVEYLELIVGGTVFFETDGTLRPMRYGTLFWHLPGDHTIFMTDRNAPYECIVFKFNRQSPIERTWPRMIQLNNRESACEFAWEMLQAFHDERSDRDALTRYAYSWLEWQAHRSALEEQVSEVPDLIRPLITLIDQRADEHVSVNDMAQVCGVSAPHLHALFKQHLDTTPHQYLLTKRLNRARHLIISTNDPIKQISRACGFDNIETFYRCFKKRFTISPGRFRKRNRPK